MFIECQLQLQLQVQIQECASKWKSLLRTISRALTQACPALMKGVSFHRLGPIADVQLGFNSAVKVSPHGDRRCHAISHCGFHHRRQIIFGSASPEPNPEPKYVIMAVPPEPPPQSEARHALGTQIVCCLSIRRGLRRRIPTVSQFRQ